MSTSNSVCSALEAPLILVILLAIVTYYKKLMKKMDNTLNGLSLWIAYHVKNIYDQLNHILG